ncbi:MAG: 1-acyl-sn-glycerol-3-phosphate acyltransferase [Gemmatimonadetes bacterium]|nr:1-acyl-sn-glycerol-3-phosphate acyltransferase [Gemmatimonadota bacterium]
MWLAPAFSLLANAAARIYYRLTIAGERVPGDGPVLLVANHPNSLIDPIVVCAAARRPVRFLAKAPLFSDFKTGWMVRAVGAIPVYRRVDDPTLMDRNTDMFRAVYTSLARGAAVGIFPEGESHSEPSMVALKTGAARIALGTHAAHGVRVPIIPVGLVFRQKDVFRSDALVVVGSPVSWGDLAGRGVEDTDAVRLLTERIGAGLRQVTLNLERWEDRPLVETVVAIWEAEWGSGLDRAQRVQRLDLTTRILADLRREPDPRWDALVRDVSGHRRRLARLRLSSKWLGTRADLVTGLKWTVRRYVLAMPIAIALAVAGFLLFALPYWWTGRVVDRLRLDVDERSSWKLLLGGTIYGAWLLALVVAATVRGGAPAGAVTLVAAPVIGMSGLLVRERWGGAWSDARRFFLLRSRRDLVATLRDQQHALAERLKALYQERSMTAGV